MTVDLHYSEKISRVNVNAKQFERIVNGIPSMMRVSASLEEKPNVFVEIGEGYFLHFILDGDDISTIFPNHHN